MAFGGGETLSPLKDILADVRISILSVFWSKTYSGMNTSFTFSIKCPLIIIIIIIIIANYYYYYFPWENSLAYVFGNLRPSYTSPVSSFGHCHSSLQPTVTPSHSELTLGCL